MGISRDPAPRSAWWPPRVRDNGRSTHSLVLWADDRRNLELLHLATCPEIPSSRLPVSALVRLALREQAARLRRERSVRRDVPGQAVAFQEPSR